MNSNMTSVEILSEIGEYTLVKVLSKDLNKVLKNVVMKDVSVSTEDKEEKVVEKVEKKKKVKDEKKEGLKNLKKCQKAIKKKLVKMDKQLEISTSDETYISGLSSTLIKSVEDQSKKIREIIEPVMNKYGYEWDMKENGLVITEEGYSFDIDFKRNENKKVKKGNKSKKKKDKKVEDKPKEEKPKKKKRVRKAPKESAKDFDEGTEKEGQDGEMYVVKVIANGQHRWMKKVNKKEEKKEEDNTEEMNKVIKSVQDYLIKKTGDKWEIDDDDKHNKVLSVRVTGETECDYTEEILNEMMVKLLKKYYPKVKIDHIQYMIVEDEVTSIDVRFG